MAGFTPNEAEVLIGQLVLKRVLTDRDADLELGLFTDTSPAETITEATIAEPTGGGYARIDLTDATWDNTAEAFDYAQQTFTATGSAYSAPVYGYFIATKSAGGTPRLLFVEIDTNGPRTMAENDVYKITPNVTVT
jgi:hypothetical protein